MKKIFAIAGLVASLAFSAQPVFAQDAEVDRLLRQMLEKSRQELNRSLQETGKTNQMVESLPLPNITVYKPRDYSQPQPPIGSFNHLNSPKAGGGTTRPSCMPYYEGCWRVR